MLYERFNLDYGGHVSVPTMVPTPMSMPVASMAHVEKSPRSSSAAGGVIVEEGVTRVAATVPSQPSL